MYSSPALVVALLVGLAALSVRALGIGRRPKDYPPGPPTIPLLGNLHQMPSRDLYLQLQKWANEYGPVYSLILGTRVLIVISSDEAWKDLLDKRSAIYSDRWDMYVGQTLASGGLRMLMMRYGATWRSRRKLVHNILNINASKAYIPYQVLENKQMLNDFLDTPNEGWRTPTNDEPRMRQFWVDMEEFTIINSAGAATLVDLYPILRWLPDAALAVQRQAKDIFRRQLPFFRNLYLGSKNALRTGTLWPCFCADLIRGQGKENYTDEAAAYIAGTMFEAGSDTTTSVLYGFVQGMLLFPAAQKAAHEELDRVIGPERLPTLEDAKSLPYIRACVKEACRWCPVTPSAFTHAVTQDDTYNGYKIPKGAGVIPNVYAIQMDPDRHPDPKAFKPERYLHLVDTNFADSVNVADAKDRDVYVFGAGRRICQGIHVAERSLFLAISRMLWAFEFRPKKDSEGNDILPEMVLTQGFVCRPEIFDVDIRPRDPARAELVRQEWDSALKTELDGDGQWKKH